LNYLVYYFSKLTCTASSIILFPTDEDGSPIGERGLDLSSFKIEHIYMKENNKSKPIFRLITHKAFRFLKLLDFTLSVSLTVGLTSIGLRTLCCGKPLSWIYSKMKVKYYSFNFYFFENFFLFENFLLVEFHLDFYFLF